MEIYVKIPLISIFYLFFWFKSRFCHIQSRHTRHCLQLACRLLFRPFTLHWVSRSYFNFPEYICKHCSKLCRRTCHVVNAGDLTQLTLGNVFCKYADDTCLVIPASNVDSRTREIENIRSWSCANNLNLNLKKSSEIVFVDSMRQRQIQLPTCSLMEGMPRVCSLKILGITINSHFLLVNMFLV